MSTLAAPISSNTSVLGETPAVEVRDLRKDFIRRDRKAGLFARKRWLARHAAEGRARTRAVDLARAAAPRRADNRSRPALEARGAEVHHGGPPPARRDDPPLHARHARGGDARGPHRHPRSRRAALPRA